MGDIPKPLPVPDARSEGFWAATGRHVLAIQRCDHCARFAHPPVVICPRCLSPDPAFTFSPVTGRGRLKTWTIMRDAFLPGFRADIPWAIGEAELDDTDGARLVARLLHPTDTQFSIDAEVETVFEDVAPGLALPRLKLVAE